MTEDTIFGFGKEELYMVVAISVFLSFITYLTSSIGGGWQIASGIIAGVATLVVLLFLIN